MSDEQAVPAHSEVIKHVIDSLFHVISQNTTPAFAWLTLRKAMQKTCYYHQFMYQIDIGEIDDLRALDVHDPGFVSTSITSVEHEIDTLPPQQIGQCIHEMIRELHQNMDPQAGYVLLHQFRMDLGEEFYQEMQTLGVNLQLTQMPREL